MRKMKNVTSITIIGRRWRDKPNGNTYHTAQIMINGKTEHTTIRHYGYENHYVQTATKWLEQNNYIPERSHERLAVLLSDLKITFEHFAIDVPRKKDL